MVAQDCVIKPHPKTTKCIFHGIVAARDWVGNKAGDLVQGNMVYAKAADKVFDIVDMFLVGLGGREGFEKPLAIMDLTNVSHLHEDGIALSHDWDFPQAVMNILNGNWGCTSSVDDTLVVPNGNKGATLIKHTPVLFNQSCKTLVFLGLQVG
jgi:hypothetical protein